MKKKKRDKPHNVQICGYPLNECIVLNVVDDKFAPDIQLNDMVIVHRQSVVENGAIAAFMMGDDTNAVLRRVRYENGDAILTVDSNACEPIIVDSNVRIVGKAVSLMCDIAAT